MGSLRAINDRALWPLIEAADEVARDAAVDQLVAGALPLVDAILDRYRRSLDAAALDDVRSTAMFRLVRRLHEVERSEDAAIASLDDFVARLAFNCVNDVLRDRFPARTRLKSRIRYALGRGGRLGSWHVGGEIVAGLAEWEGRPAGEQRAPTALPRGDIDKALLALFLEDGGPLRLESVVDAIAMSWGIAEDDAVPAERFADNSATALADLEAQEELQLAWREIRALQPNQRVALLLNLRDRSSAMIESFVMLGIASIDELAAAMEMSAEELAELWNSLPLDDHAIAARLGIVRQQVINLRRAARERLARRMKRARR